MKLLFYLGHPAHYHLFKFTIKEFQKQQHDITVVIRQKDVLEQILKEENVTYIKIGSKIGSKNKISVLVNGLADLIKSDFKLYRLCRHIKPNMMIGTNYSITHVGRALKIKSIVLNEDDFNVNKFFCKLAYPFADHIISPNVCDVGPYQSKKIGYDGYQKLAYLHPNHFKPDASIVKKQIPENQKYAIIRLVNFNAGHDIESSSTGLRGSIIDKTIENISAHGVRVYISSETKVDAKYEKHVLKIRAADIHHFLYYSSLLISDSQSMSVEAALLGVPCIRYNSFVGKISVLNELENLYQLCYGVSLGDSDKLFKLINSILSDNNYKDLLQERREKMLSSKIDLTSFLIWFLGTYPSSYASLRSDPGSLKQFISRDAYSV